MADGNIRERTERRERLAGQLLVLTSLVTRESSLTSSHTGLLLAAGMGHVLPCFAESGRKADLTSLLAIDQPLIILFHHPSSIIHHPSSLLPPLAGQELIQSPTIIAQLTNSLGNWVRRLEAPYDQPPTAQKRSWEHTPVLEQFCEAIRYIGDN